jgi:hypothetical protein
MAFAENHRTKVQPLPAEVAQALVKFLEGKLMGEPIWLGSRIQRAAMMLRPTSKPLALPTSWKGQTGQSIPTSTPYGIRT